MKNFVSESVHMMIVNCLATDVTSVIISVNAFTNDRSVILAPKKETDYSDTHINKYLTLDF